MNTITALLPLWPEAMLVAAACVALLALAALRDYEERNY